MTNSLRMGATAILLMSACGAASAADLGGYRRGAVDQPMPAMRDDGRPQLWQGFYAGVTGGIARSTADVKDFGTHSDLRAQFASVGGHVGYNIVNGPWLLGAEADVMSNGFFKNKYNSVPGVGDLGGTSGALGSLRVRGGYVVNNLLLYGTAGVAFTNVKVNSSLGGTAEFKTGLVAGLGVEYAFDKAWTARLEGLNYSFNDKNADLAGITNDTKLTTSTVRLGLTRRF
jgi:outer membrane immunogenic protein